MSVSPPPERIDVCTPPDSPDTAWNDPEPVQIPIPASSPAFSRPITPPKAHRLVAPRRRLKRRRVDPPASIQTGGNENNSSQASDVSMELSRKSSLSRVSQNLNRPWFNDLILDGTNWPTYPEMGLEHPGWQPENSHPPGDLTRQEIDPYEHYVDAALADCCGFYQINKELFVVQGWDSKGQRATVSSYSIQPTLGTDQVLSLDIVVPFTARSYWR
jgi:hypothetical protein